jgi:hypothetical protein
MYYLVQRYSFEKFHLTKSLSYTLCGRTTNRMNFPYGDRELKGWLIERTTCKSCKSIAEKLIKK